MMRWIRRPLWFVAATLLLAPAVAQEPTPSDREAMRAELRGAMQQYFQNRLREELALTDEQLHAIAPALERLERAKQAARSERQQTVRRLQRGLRAGGSDEELRGLLDRLEAIEDEQHRLQRDTLETIDGTLTVRQQVQLRFFIQRFQREFYQRVRELRGEQRPGPDRRPDRRPGRPGR